MAKISNLPVTERRPGWCGPCNQLQIMYRQHQYGSKLSTDHWRCGICGTAHPQLRQQKEEVRECV